MQLAFDADGGLLGVGATVEAIYELDDAWAIEGAVSYERLKNDAADIDAAATAAWEKNSQLIQRLARVETLTDASVAPKGSATIAIPGETSTHRQASPGTGGKPCDTVAIYSDSCGCRESI